ncbi:hypothetical protein G7081_03750 [Vagococcus coleopterorum]|uniref:Uncharacterized protein n=1 Tax=Vagococcus coleopterorum TaxID=2714946 RepID=A0A6G8AMD5_9ENTE|nr:hypothetical protein [Vagococcus coleopterorum]QIL46244.1 hypothetical protein G7081_03750 [Vagococcus coleopterorum]
MSEKTTEKLTGKIAAISQTLAAIQTSRPHITYSKKTNLSSNLYLKQQLHQTNQLLAKLEINLAEDLDKLKEID